MEESIDSVVKSGGFKGKYLVMRDRYGYNYTYIKMHNNIWICLDHTLEKYKIVKDSSWLDNLYDLDG